jgi:flagellar motor switch protein FliG
MGKGNASSIKTWSNRSKVAALMLILDPGAASNIMRNMEDDQEVVALAKEISLVGHLNEDDQLLLLDEIYDVLQIQKNVATGSLDTAENLLIEAYGEEGASNIIDKMTSAIQRVPFEFLRLVDAEQIANTIQHEHTQVITLVLSYLKIEKAAQVLQNLPEEIRSDVAIRLAKMDRTNPEILSVVERILERRFAGVIGQSDLGNAVGGIESLAEILNRVDRNTEKRILEDLEVIDTDLATEIRNLMFVFEDIVKLDDKSIQRLLRDVDSKDLSLALKGSDKNIREVFFKNMSEKAAKLLRDDIEMMGPVLMRDVSETQTKIVGTVRALEQAGEIIILGNSEEDMMVE